MQQIADENKLLKIGIKKLMYKNNEDH